MMQPCPSQFVLGIVQVEMLYHNRDLSNPWDWGSENVDVSLKFSLGSKRQSWTSIGPSTNWPVYNEGLA